jgi:hypothetical protein
MRSTRHTPLLVLPALLVSACGARTGLDDGVLASDAGPDTETGLASDARHGEDASVPDGGLPRGATHVGFVLAVASNNIAVPLAQFFPTAGTPPACAYVVPVGACSLVRCPAEATLQGDNAGPIDVTTGCDGLTSVATLSYQGASPTGSYSSSDGVQAETGATIDFVGHGGPDVPAFDLRVTMPSAGQLITPAFVANETIDTSVDLDLAWDPIPFGEAAFFLSTSPSPEEAYQLACFFDGTTGSGVVPKANLAAIRADAAGSPGLLTFLAVSRTQAVRGQWAIEAVAYVSQAGFSGPVNLE